MPEEPVSMAASPGLYGKLPAKRDFIALNLPSGFLGVWEEWLQSSVAASREQLGERWLDLFLSQPIWRFWLGRDICGTAMTGALMPSVDGVGRYFPLCLCAAGNAGARLDPPPVHAMAQWFEAAEAALLAALDPDFAGNPLELVANVPPLPDQPMAGDAEHHLEALLKAELAASLAGESWWWTLGGGQIPPAVRRYRGLPEPYAFSRFMLVPLGSEAAA
jgi:type VI secretion system protein ImpM